MNTIDAEQEHAAKKLVSLMTSFLFTQPRSQAPWKEPGNEIAFN